MNYGEGYLGNDQDRINEIETEAEVLFVSSDLGSCLKYYKETGDVEPLEQAIFENELDRHRIFVDLVATIKVLRKADLQSVANFLCTARDIVKKTN